MKILLKKFLNKHKNRIFSFIAVIACIPLFTFNVFALTPTYPQYNLDINNVWSDTINQAFKLGDDGVYSSDVSTAKTVTSITIRLFDDNSETDTALNFPILPDVYDYYIYTSYAQRTTGGSFSPNDIIITDGSGVYEYDARLTDKQHYITRFIDSNANYGIVKQNFVAKLNLVDSSSAPNRIGGITFKGSSGTLKSVQYFELSVFLVPKGDSSAMGNIVNAINNQTNALGGKLDGIDNGIQQGNDLIENGNGNTSEIVGDNNSAVDNLDSVVSAYRDVEQSFFDDFNANQQAITSDIVGWSWGGLVNCANWVGNTLTDYYNNMGDFRQFIIYPLMLGIALFFLGRGGSIIGHLFRKPTETTVNTKSVFRREGNTRYTTTTTSRKGGVWRK